MIQKITLTMSMIEDVSCIPIILPCKCPIISYHFHGIPIIIASMVKTQHPRTPAPVKDWRGPQGLHHQSLIVLGHLGWNPRQVVWPVHSTHPVEGKVVEIPRFFEGFMTIKGGETLNDVFFSVHPKACRNDPI